MVVVAALARFLALKADFAFFGEEFRRAVGNLFGDLLLNIAGAHGVRKKQKG